MNITQEELLSALRDALEKPPDGEGMTVQEMAEATGHLPANVRKALGVVARDGRLIATRVYRPDISGRMVQVPAYRIESK